MSAELRAHTLGSVLLLPLFLALSVGFVWVTSEPLWASVGFLAWGSYLGFGAIRSFRSAP